MEKREDGYQTEQGLWQAQMQYVGLQKIPNDCNKSFKGKCW